MKFKKPLAVLTAAALLASIPTSAFAAGSDWGDSSVDGGGSVQNPIIRYQIPTNLDFAVNAFQIGDASNSQIYSPDYTIINKSDVAIQVGVKAWVTNKTGGEITDADPSGVKLKGNPDDVLFEGTDKTVYMEVVAPTPTGVVVATTGTAAASGNTAAAATPIAKKPTSTVVTEATPGTATDIAKYTMDVAGFTGGVGTTGKFIFTFAGKEFPVAVSTAMADTKLATDLAALTDKSVTVGDRTLAMTASGTVITFTADAAGVIDNEGVNLSSYSVMVGGAGTEGTVALDDTTWPTFADPDNVNAVLGTAAAAPDASAISFALEKATYVTPGTGVTEKTLFDSIAKETVGSDTFTRGATSFRFMGKANPGAAWKADDLHVKAVFSVTGLNNDMYTKAVADATTDGVFTKGANVISVGGAASSSSGIKLTTPGPITAVANTVIPVTVTDGNTYTKVDSVTEKGTTTTLAGAHKIASGNLTIAVGFNTAPVKGKTYVVIVSTADDATKSTLEITFNP